MAGEKVQLVGEAAKIASKKAAEGLKTFGSNVAAVSREIVTTAKLNTRKAHKQKELDEHYRKLGELAYGAGNLQGEMAALAEKIREDYDELQELEVQLNNARKEKVCPSCSAKNQQDDEFCPKCGERL